jgi:hypothetical protein
MISCSEMLLAGILLSSIDHMSIEYQGAFQGEVDVSEEFRN